MSKANATVVQDSTLRTALHSIPEDVSFLSIRTFGEYILADSLGRRLLKRNNFGIIESDLASHWEVKNGHRVFIFALEANQKFSNGTMIELEDVVHSFKRLRLHKKALIHVNDKNIIKSISLTKENKIRIELSRPKKEFISMLLHPEFSIVPREASGSSSTFNSYKVTSGPYYLEERSKSEIVLKKNKYFYNNKDYIYNTIKIRLNPPLSKILTMIEEKKIDYFTSPALMDKDTHEKVINQGWLFRDQDVGFSYFLSFSNLGINGIGHKDRLYYAKIFFDMKKAIEWGKHIPFLNNSQQVYLQNGPGRISKSEVSDIVDRFTQEHHKRKRKIDILLRKGFLFEKHIRKTLASNKIETNIDHYNDFKEYEEKIKKNSYDLVQSNNDFSQIDLIENLKVALNPQRPLIWAPEGDLIFDWLKEAIDVGPTEKRYNLIKKIGKRLLSQAYAIPLYHYKKLDYHHPSVSLSGLSKSYPDFSLWKVRKSEKPSTGKSKE